MVFLGDRLWILLESMFQQQKSSIFDIIHTYYYIYIYIMYSTMKFINNNTHIQIDAHICYMYLDISSLHSHVAHGWTVCISVAFARGPACVRVQGLCDISQALGIKLQWVGYAIFAP